MATGSSFVSTASSHQLKDKVPREFHCRKCSQVCERLTKTSCCGENFCLSCISPQRKDGYPCPSCGKNNYDISESEEHQQRLDEFLVFCPFQREGCIWYGPFKELKSHVDPCKDGCKHVSIACPLGCQLEVLKSRMKQHIASDCTERELTCQGCQTKSSLELDIPSSQSKLLCHNEENVDSRDTKSSPLYEGCEVSEFHRKLLHKLGEQEIKLQALSLELATSNRNLQEQIERNATATKELRDMVIVKHDFEIGNITRRTLGIESSTWTSQASYTFFSGYRYCICLTSRGYSLMVQLKVLPGDFDHLLKWPLQASFTLELHKSWGSRNLKGITGTRSWKRPPQANNSHVFYFRPNPAEIYKGFIELSMLDSFLKNDQLCFSIMDVTVYNK